MADSPTQHASQGDPFAWIDPGVSVWDQWGAVPPPPKVKPTTALPTEAVQPAIAPEPAPASAPLSDPEPLPEPSSDFDPPPPAGEGVDEQAPPTFHHFDAELDVAELDERLRPVTTWSARATSVNRSSMSIRTRRMCYAKTILLVAVHLIDDKPIILAGRVISCDYAEEGLYLVDIELMPKPDSTEIRDWESNR
ncbi:MAG: hypothetical protein HRU13_04105 [Phycisphaerales bacterium]|nr:hypothetical protein [Phycisphaerales bacterium]